jgi:hypothetical protein
MKNVTLTLDDELHQRARVAAATQGKSLSKFVAGMIEDYCSSNNQQFLHNKMIEAFLSGPPLLDASTDLVKRQEMYEERTNALFRRHERPAIYKDEGPLPQE